MDKKLQNKDKEGNKQNLFDATKTVIRGKFIAYNVNIRNRTENY